MNNSLFMSQGFYICNNKNIKNWKIGFLHSFIRLFKNDSRPKQIVK